MIGLNGVRSDRPDQIGAAWEEALRAERPTVLDFKTDPEVSPIAPHVTFEKAKHFATALTIGDSHEGSVIVNTAKQMLSGLLSKG